MMGRYRVKFPPECMKAKSYIETLKRVEDGFDESFQKMIGLAYARSYVREMLDKHCSVFGLCVRCGCELNRCQCMKETGGPR